MYPYVELVGILPEVSRPNDFSSFQGGLPYLGFLLEPLAKPLLEAPLEASVEPLVPHVSHLVHDDPDGHGED